MMRPQWRWAVAATFGVALAAQADSYVPGSASDPAVRMADFLAADARYFSALAELEQLPNTRLPADQLAPDYARKLADSSLNYGMRERAGEIYRQLVANAKTPEELQRAKLRVAEFDFQRGYLQQANDELVAMREGLDKDVLADWQELQTRVLLAQGRYAEAEATAPKPDDNRKPAQYIRYNLGVAKINQGKVQEGHDLLDRVGRFSANDDEGLALRDKANLVLAYDFLRREQGGTAVPVFQRIRLDGQFANRALLGLGWAEMAPRGKLQVKRPEDEGPAPFGSYSTIGTIMRPGYLDDIGREQDRIYRRANTGTQDNRSIVQRALELFKPNALAGKSAAQRSFTPAQEAAFKRALVPWVELLGRDPMDPAVQEGMLAIPYTLDRLGAHEQAQQFYLRAIDALEQTRKNLAAAMSHVKRGRMLTTIVSRDKDSETGWTWRLHDLPDAPETFYLQTLLAENRMQEAIKNYRDAAFLSRNLQVWQDRLTALQAAYNERGDDTSKAPVELVMDYVKSEARAPLNYEVSEAPKLQLSESLSPPKDTDASSGPQAVAPLKLEAAKTPDSTKFSGGTWERFAELRTRILQLKPQIDDAAAQEKAHIEAIAVEELQRQDKVAETYLVEARLALARLYDRRGGGDAP